MGKIMGVPMGTQVQVTGLTVATNYRDVNGKLVGEVHLILDENGHRIVLSPALASHLAAVITCRVGEIWSNSDGKIV